MDVKVGRDQENELIRVTVIGFLTPGARQQLLMLAATELHSSHVNKVLIDVTRATSDTDLPMVTALSLIGFLKKLKVPPQVRFAFLCNTSQSFHRYFELVARGDGYHIRHFQYQDDALAWLDGAPPVAPASRAAVSGGDR